MFVNRLEDCIKRIIRDIPDFPKKGIVFKDITPLLADAKLFEEVTERLSEYFSNKDVTKVAAIDARGFLFAGAVAVRLKAGVVPIRKEGKLPYKTYTETYELEYGSSTLAIHIDSFRSNDNVILIDDLLATGGTALAAANLIKKAGGRLLGMGFVIELTFLNGRTKLSDYDIFSIVKY